MKRVILVLLFWAISCLQADAQMTIDNSGYTISQLVNQLLVPAGSGVSVSNVSFKGVYNHTQSGVARYQVGAFSTTGTVETQLGFSGGVVLSTGNTSAIPLALATNPGSAAQMSLGYTSSTPGEIRDDVATSVSAGGGDDDAHALTSPERNINSAILEFDFVPDNPSISFRYRFSSEEYEDASGIINYNCSSYNDKFAFLISGPGINNGTTFANSAENIARLSNGSQVAINAVNNGVVGSSGGSPSAGNCTAANPAWVNGTPTSEFAGLIYGIGFNGNTQILTASKSGLTPQATYHIRLIVTDAKDGAYDSAVFLEAGSFTSPAPLPVELSYWQANPLPDRVELQWGTRSEVGHDYFELEQSEDGEWFVPIGQVKESTYGTGTEKHYRFTHNTPAGIHYYRLKQIDLNGTARYTSILRTQSSSTSEPSVYPNPTTDELRISLPNQAATAYTAWTLSDAVGKTLNWGEATQETSISLKDYPKGVYYLKMKTAAGESFTKRVLKH